MRSCRHNIWVVLGLAAVATGSVACGDDAGSPTGPTPAVPPVVETQSDEDAARQSVDAWLVLLDAGNYSEAYDATGSFFRESVTAEEFQNKMEERQAILGAVESRTLDSTQRLSILPDAPPGDYFIFEIDGVYELRPNARERVTAVSDEWPVVGIYLIR
ncbi:MAG: DUF4019 domain-containing protein [Acidobacteria bacterium]|nr:DUF4019 domain-containing protein [Acidobacteriota bacterium]